MRIRFFVKGAKVMNEYRNIEVNPDVMLGKTVIRGTRIPVELVIRKLAEGATIEDLLDAYPDLTKEKIRILVRQSYR